MNRPDTFSNIARCQIGIHTKIVGWANLYDSEIGSFCLIGPFVEIGGAKIGDRTKVSSHCYIPPLTEIGNDCFISHGVKICNDTFTSPIQYDNISEMEKEWNPKGVKIGNCVRIGSNATIMAGVEVGDHSIIGAGAVVIRNVGKCEIVAGVPARMIDTTSNSWEQFS